MHLYYYSHLERVETEEEEDEKPKTIITEKITTFFA